MTFTFKAPIPLFHVFNLGISVEFYRGLLNFEVVSTPESGDDDVSAWVMLRAGELTLMLQGPDTAEDSPEVLDASRHHCHADTVLYLVCNDLKDLCAHLRQRGVAPVKGSPVFPNMDEVFVQDPDGYTLCFHAPAEDRIRHEP